MSQVENSTGIDQKFLHIKEIEVIFEADRPRYPFFVKIKVGDNVRESLSFNSEEEGLVRWTPDGDLRIAVSTDIAIAVQQQGKCFKRKKNYAIFKIESSQLTGKDIFSVPDGKGRATVKISCASVLPTEQVAERLLEEAGEGVKNKKVLLESLDKADIVFDTLKQILDFASSVHPAIGIAASAVNALREKCKAQKDCHEAASALVHDLVSFMPFVKDIPQDSARKAMTSKTVTEMLELFCKISESIIKYSSEGFFGSLISDHKSEMDIAKADYVKLRETYDWCIKLEVWGSVSTIERRTEDVQLQRLRPATKAFYNTEGVCLEGTRERVLRQIEEWGVSESKLFWLHGVAGSGKSSIANSVAHMFNRKLRLSGCFFCKRDDPECRNPGTLLPTLAYHLSKWHNLYRSAVISVIEGGSEPELAQGLERQFDLLITQSLASLSAVSEGLPPHPLVVVIDALDECGSSRSDRSQVAKLIVRLSRAVPWLKVFVTSRTLAEFQKVFLQTDIDCDVLDINTMVDNGQLKSDISLYTKHCALEYDIKLDDAQIKLLVEKAVGLFIWISTVFKFAGGRLDRQGTITGILTSSSSGKQELELDIIYMAVIQSAFKDPEDVQSVKIVLGIIAFTAKYRPLTEKAIVYFLVSNNIDLRILKVIINSLQAVIFRDELSHGAICTCHPSFLDFICTESRSQMYWTNPAELGSLMATICLQIMKSELKFNICELESSLVPNDEVTDIEDRISKYIPEHLQYSCLYWMNHFAHSSLDISDQQMQYLLKELLCHPRALYWLECLSILKSLKMGIDTLISCMNRFQSVGCIATMCQELYRFISAYYTPASVSTPHLYLSALSWVPTESNIAKTLYPHFSNQPLVSVGKEARWQSILLTSNAGGSVQCVAYSPDGTHIVSGSGDKTLRIWDAQTGDAVGEPLTGHSEKVTSVSYSPDGRRIVSGSEDKTLRFWDVQTGDAVGQPLTGHSDSVSSVTYSPDGKHIVSGSMDETFRIWDMNAGLVNWQWMIYPQLDWKHDIGVDGWIRGISNELFLWVPHDLRNNARIFDMSNLCIPRNSPLGPIQVNWELLIKYSGSSWANIH